MKNQNSCFTDTKFKNSNNASRIQNANKSVHNQNHSEYENVIKNSKQVNIAHMDAPKNATKKTFVAKHY